MSEIFVSLLGGLIGAIIASVITIGYTEFTKHRENKKNIAREKLEKLYGPLILLIKKTKAIRQSREEIDILQNEEEEKMVDNLLFSYYYLVDDDLKEDIAFLHSQLRVNTLNLTRRIPVIEKIIKHYKENKIILGIE